jgi:hypothetical protein
VTSSAPTIRTLRRALGHVERYVEGLQRRNRQRQNCALGSPSIGLVQVSIQNGGSTNWLRRPTAG